MARGVCVCVCVCVRVCVCVHPIVLVRVYKQSSFSSTQLALFKKLPCRALTRLWGQIALIHLSPLTRRPILGLFCFLYGIKLDDVKQKELRQYSSLHDFFTRVLKEESRPICHDHSLVS